MLDRPLTLHSRPDILTREVMPEDSHPSSPSGESVHEDDNFDEDANIEESATAQRLRIQRDRRRAQVAEYQHLAVLAAHARASRTRNIGPATDGPRGTSAELGRGTLGVPVDPGRIVQRDTSALLGRGTLRVPTEGELENAHREARLQQGLVGAIQPVAELRIKPGITLEEFVDDQIAGEARDKKRKAAEKKKAEAVRKRGEKSRRIIANIERNAAEQGGTSRLEEQSAVRGSSSRQIPSAFGHRQARPAVNRLLPSSGHFPKPAAALTGLQSAERGSQPLAIEGQNHGENRARGQTLDGEMPDHDPQGAQSRLSERSNTSIPVLYPPQRRPQRTPAPQTARLEFVGPADNLGGSHEQRQTYEVEMLDYIPQPQAAQVEFGLPTSNLTRHNAGFAPAGRYTDTRYAPGQQGGGSQPSPSDGSQIPQTGPSHSHVSSGFPPFVHRPLSHADGIGDSGERMPAHSTGVPQFWSMQGDQRIRHPARMDPATGQWMIQLLPFEPNSPWATDNQWLVALRRVRQRAFMQSEALRRAATQEDVPINQVPRSASAIHSHNTTTGFGGSQSPAAYPPTPVLPTSHESQPQHPQQPASDIQHRPTMAR